MKKVLLTAYLMMALLGSTFAAGIYKIDDETKVASFVLRKFESDYSAAENVTWTLTNNDLYKATFTINGAEMSSYYDWENNHIATTQVVGKDQLSEKALARIAKNYQGYEIASVLKHYDGTSKHLVTLKKVDKEVIVKVASDDCVFFYTRIK